MPAILVTWYMIKMVRLYIFSGILQAVKILIWVWMEHILYCPALLAKARNLCYSIKYSLPNTCGRMLVFQLLISLHLFIVTMVIGTELCGCRTNGSCGKQCWISIGQTLLIKLHKPDLIPGKKKPIKVIIVMSIFK